MMVLKRRLVTLFSFGLLSLGLVHGAVPVQDVLSGLTIHIPTVISVMSQTVVQRAPSQLTPCVFPTSIDISDYHYLTYTVASLATGDIKPMQFRLSVQDHTGHWWQQRTAHVAYRSNATFQLPLRSDAWLSGTTTATPNFESIRAIQILSETSPKQFVATTYAIDVSYVSDQTDPMAQLASTKILVFSADTTGPSISQVLVDQHTPIDNEFIGVTPKLSALILDSDSGASTWNITVLNATTGATVTQRTSRIGGAKTATVVTFNVSTALPNGAYTFRVSAYDVDGNLSTSNTATVLVRSELDMDHVYNSPNPFNPDRESTQLEYNLTRAADLSIFIYALNGELQKTYQFSSTESGGLAGFNRVDWDGKNRFGEVVANGVYVAYLIAKADGKVKKGKIKLWVRK